MKKKINDLGLSALITYRAVCDLEGVLDNMYEEFVESLKTYAVCNQEEAKEDLLEVKDYVVKQILEIYDNLVDARVFPGFMKKIYDKIEDENEEREEIRHEL